ncbi:CPBP family intramembrane metalloprotease [Staphylococcus caprae]|nr:CPBP family intramembrane metalloprotease [Staphylococcus caprae]
MIKLFKNNIFLKEDNYFVLLTKITIVSILLLFSNGLMFANNFYFSLIGVCLFFLSFVLMFLFKLKIFKFERIQTKTILKSFLILILMIGIIYSIDYISHHMTYNNVSKQTSLSNLSVKNLINIIIISPIVEEIIFRSFLITGLFRRFQFLGFLFSSLSFSLFHSPDNLFAFLIYLVIGLILGISLLLFKRLEIPILIHCCYNLSVIFIF